MSSYTWTEFGEGSGSVYLYYFPCQKKHVQQVGAPVWECKIGYTEEEDVHAYIERQAKKSRKLFDIPDTEYPEMPVLFKTDTPKELETQIHKILKLFRRKVKIKKQREWFFTNPDEVIQIYLFLDDFDPLWF